MSDYKVVTYILNPTSSGSKVDSYALPAGYYVTGFAHQWFPTNSAHKASVQFQAVSGFADVGTGFTYWASWEGAGDLWLQVFCMEAVGTTVSNSVNGDIHIVTI